VVPSILTPVVVLAVIVLAAVLAVPGLRVVLLALLVVIPKVDVERSRAGLVRLRVRLSVQVQHTEIMLRMLIQIFGEDGVARHLRVARLYQIALIDMGSCSANPALGAVAVELLIGSVHVAATAWGSPTTARTTRVQAQASSMLSMPRIQTSSPRPRG